ncbi:TPA: DNA repair protein RecO [candidate division CPR2 bacterium]|uniref:DNA repair protein RecO n=1 Tax=candidate division CPR2 bacterium GW2011_GWC1_41_48 TaxID=1618344 RepID=A0A0G0YJY8_UNCC2|nr:MAG: repair protein RecO protein [candidate division CPR2 bacterium GW2011_GWC2_39_35]KKR28880.1 MAG: repair protein RecO protein [candidate division CPR2 bacterium GW2011_GWD1_39_7]KKR29147.1 MAG: repair protein RecO protein [candidate division CPR2 bacterium GW2011_GWD2_39_7]KKS09861.1 MAG: repair protein RecO protein [candidate division CPR2 bacterium GW2011_GWC1_41_48]OGB61508.1 MAG: DNA repair protein RecO [candidate division CPR2 bacterium GWD1_39_7]OGB70638.1 MAG: DNA repair protein 
MTYKTEGIIIKRSSFKEADLLLKVFTPAKGKITVISKGARKIKSKMAGSLDLFYLNNFMFAEGKNFDTLCSAETKERFLFLREDLGKLGKAYYLAEILDKIIPDREPNPAVYREFIKALNGLKISPELALSIFEIRIFSKLGFGPELESCVNCHESLDPGKCSLSKNFGGVLCHDCFRKDPEAYAVSDNAIKLMRMMLRFDQDIIIKVSNLDELLMEIKKFNESYIEKILHRSLKSKQFIAKVNIIN